MVRAAASFKGGYKFRTFQGTPKGPLQFPGPPKRVSVPLQQGSPTASEITVEAGDQVSQGEVIARRPGGEGCPVHSPITGKVVQLALTCKSKELRAIVLESGEPQPPSEKEPDQSSWKQMDPGELFELLREAGVTALFPGGRFPQCAPGGEAQEIHTLLVCCLHTAPLLPKAAVFYQGLEEAVAQGSTILSRALKAKQLLVALEKGESSLETTLKDRFGIEIVELKPVYPQEHEALITKAVLQTQPAAGNGHVLCVTGRTALAAYNAAVKGEPVIRLPVSVGGSALKEGAIVQAYVGTPVKELAAPYLKEDVEVRYVAGNFLTGKAVSGEFPLTRDTECITVLPENRQRRFLSFTRAGPRQDSYSNSFLGKFLSLELKNDTNIHGEYRPCINCGWCEYVCPARIMPDMIMKLLRIDDLGEAENLGIMDCIECGLCSYVCPSKLPLYEELVAGKESVRKELRDG